jgi:hypothetical protein
MRYSLEHIKTWSNYNKQQRSKKHWKQFAHRKNQETQEEKGCRTELECRVEDIFGKLPTTAQGSELPVVENIDQIAQELINIRRRSRLSVDRLDQQLHQQ